MGCPVTRDVVADNQSTRSESLSPIPEYSEVDSLDNSTTSRSKRLSIELHRDEMPSNEHAVFLYDDFQVPARIVQKRNKSLPTNRQSSDGAQVFQFGDFKVQVVDEVGPPKFSNGTADEAARSFSRQTSRKLLTPKPQYKTIHRTKITTRLGHGGRVKCIAITPNEKEYVSCSNEETRISLFELRSGKERGYFEGHQDSIINATFSYDGKYLATTSRDRTMILWDVVTTKHILTFEHSKVVICCCFSKDSKFIATGCQDKVCRVWDTRRGREMLIFAQHEGIIISMSFSPDGTSVASASADRSIRIWSTMNGKTRFVLHGHIGIVLACMYSQDGRQIISNDEKLLMIWNALDGTCTKCLNVDNWGTHVPARKLTWTLSCTAPGEFSKYIIVACNNKYIYVLDTDSGEEQFSFLCRAPVYCLTVGQENFVAFGDSFGNVYMLELT